MCEQGPEPEQQGYCGLCRVLYKDLTQHLSSPRHREAAGQSSPRHRDTAGQSTTGANHSSQSAHNLLERFLHDVLKHHPNSYGKSPSDLGEHQKDTQQQEEVTPTPQTSATTPKITWAAWQQNRRWQQRADFSSEHSSSTIEQVIRHYCYSQDDDSSVSGSVHFSLPISIETQTDWDIEIQEVPAQADVSLLEPLLELQVNVEQNYSQQLQWVLEAPEDRRGYLEQPIETVLPLPQCIPPSFRGKSWAVIEKEDEARVLKLIQQFKEGVRTCYFDSESLARYGWRDYKKEINPNLLPLFEHEIEMEPTNRRTFSRAARCQVVKLSRATQTLHVPSPTVATSPKAQPLTEPMCEASPPEAVLPGPPAPDQLLHSEVLSEKYTSVLYPLQRQTSILYLLCSPHGSDTSPSRRRRRRPPRHLGSKVTYKRLPLTPFTVKPFSVESFTVKARCVRQLFRNLSPELNTVPAPNVIPATTPRREGLRSCRPLS